MSHIEIGPWPDFNEEMALAAASVVRSGRVNYWTGTEAKSFEKEFAQWVGSPFGIAMANGTVALEVALEALGIRAGDEVIVPSRTFLATASATLRVGARPVFADVDRSSGTLTAATIQAVLSDRTRAIIPVHLGGFPAPMPEIMALAERSGLSVIEDCAQAHGATVHGRKVGSWAHVGAFSFCQDKILTTAGEGGFITTADAQLFKKMWAIKDHGKSFDAVFHREHPPGFRWLHETSGTNYRMSEAHAAVGRVALKELPSWLEQRRNNASRVAAALSDFSSIRVPLPEKESSSAFYRLYGYLTPSFADRRVALFAELEKRGIPGRTGSCSEIYLERVFQDNNLAPRRPLPVAQELGETAVEFMTHPGITGVLDEYCDALRSAFREFEGQ